MESMHVQKGTAGQRILACSQRVCGARIAMLKPMKKVLQANCRTLKAQSKQGKRSAASDANGWRVPCHPGARACLQSV